MPKLSSTQQKVVTKLQEEPTGQLRRYRGGFWTTPSTLLPAGSPIGRVDAIDYDPSRHGAPAWWVSIATVHAMEQRKLLTRAQEFPEEWRDTRIMKPIGGSGA